MPLLFLVMNRARPYLVMYTSLLLPHAKVATISELGNTVFNISLILSFEVFEWWLERVFMIQTTLPSWHIATMSLQITGCTTDNAISVQ